MRRPLVSGGIAAALGLVLFLVVGCAGTSDPEPEPETPSSMESPETAESEGGLPDSENPALSSDEVPPAGELPPPAAVADTAPPEDSPPAAGVDTAPPEESPRALVADTPPATDSPAVAVDPEDAVDRETKEGPSELPAIPGESMEKSTGRAPVAVVPPVSEPSALDDPVDVPTAPRERTPIYPNPLLDDARPVPGYQPSPVVVAPPQRELVPPPSEVTPEEVAEPPAPPPVVVTEAPAQYLPGPGELTVVLEGSGWILRSDLMDTDSWRFLGRETGGGRTRFTFEFPETGDWDLVFERQDVAAGVSERTFRRIVVEDSPGETSRAAAARDPAPEIPDDPEYRASTARTAWEEGRHAEALALWEADAERRDSYGVDARRSLIAAAAALGDAGTLSTWLPVYLDDEVSEDILESAWTALDGQAGYAEAAAPVLRRLVEFDDNPRRPEWLYRLAYALEQPGSSRDLDMARVLYIEVLEDWPLSDWRYLSEERLQWLDRHYFRVR